MDINDIIEKIKRNWKRILLIGIASYLGLTILSMVIGYSFIKDRKKKIENHEDKIGREFKSRKEDFRENFTKSWNEKVDKLNKGLLKSEKSQNKTGLDGLKSSQETAKKMLSNSGLFSWPERPESEKIQLEQEIKESAELIALDEAAFKKKWFSQKDTETLEQFVRRQDEGAIDWQLSQLDYYAWMMKDMTDEYKLEDWKESLDETKEYLAYLHQKFEEKYGEPYDGAAFREACVVLQEQARQESQAFLDDLAASQAAGAQKKELRTLMQLKNSVVCEEKTSKSFGEKNPYTRIRHLHELLGLYSEFNFAKATFEDKWGIEVDELLKKCKEKYDAEDSNSPSYTGNIKWGFIPDDYLAKVKELENLLPKMEKDFDAKVIEDLKGRIPIEEADLNKLQDKMNKERQLVYPENIKWDEEKEKREKLKLRPSILALETASQKKWAPQREDETLEQFERRQQEGNIQFLTALIERRDLDGFKRTCKWEEPFRLPKNLSAKGVLSQEEEDFFKRYGEPCPQSHIPEAAAI